MRMLARQLSWWRQFYTLTGRVQEHSIPLAQIGRAQAAMNFIATVRRYRLVHARTELPDRTISTRNAGFAQQCSSLFARWPGGIQFDAKER